jgi:hypothetical protein
MSFIELTGQAKLDRRTKDLVKRLSADDIAIIDHADIDRVSAEELVESGVRVVVNVAPSQSGRFRATKVMDIVLRQPAASALFRIELDDPALEVTAINDTSGSAHFVPQGDYFVMAFAGTPAVGTEEVLSIRYSDGTSDHLRLTF